MTVQSTLAPGSSGISLHVVVDMRSQSPRSPRIRKSRRPRRHHQPEDFLARRRIDIEDILNHPTTEAFGSVSPSPSPSLRSSEGPTSNSDARSRLRRPDHMVPQRRERTSSTSDGDSQPAEERLFRPPYEEEQSCFVWFHKVDLNMSWAEVARRFNEQWPTANRKASGMQCKLYRFTDSKGVPKCRQREDPAVCGMWPVTGHSFPWMEPYADQLPGEHGPQSVVMTSLTTSC